MAAKFIFHHYAYQLPDLSQTAFTLTKVASDYCSIDSSGTSGYVFHPIDLQSGSMDDSLLRHRYGERGLRMAQAVGLTSLLMRATLLEQQQRPDQPASNEYLTILLNEIVRLPVKR